jgi:putative methyltransferase (TIGR04325 family)
LAAWDRDGATFAQPHLHAPLLAALRDSARAEGGRLHLVDFGGGLGGTWRQYSPSLSDLADVRWSVVEQPHFVEVGQREFTDTRLSFQPTLAKAQSETAATVVLFSSVLQYVPDPHALLAEAVQLGFRHVIIDRTSFWNGGRDRLTVQFTPPGLGGGSYPCWLFDQVRLFAPLSETHERVSEWPGFDDVDARVQFHGMYFKRKLGST